MKLLLIIALFGCYLAGMAFCQVMPLQTTTNYVTVAAQAQVITTSAAPTTFTNLDAVVLGQQLGRLTNASGQLLFPSALFTNHTSRVAFMAYDVGQVICSNITVTAECLQ